MTLCFSFAAFKMLPFIFFHFNYYIYWCGSVWFYLVWDPLCFLAWYICFLLHVWRVFSHNFTEYNSVLFSLRKMCKLALSESMTTYFRQETFRLSKSTRHDYCPSLAILSSYMHMFLYLPNIRLRDIDLFVTL